MHCTYKLKLKPLFLLLGSWCTKKKISEIGYELTKIKGTMYYSYTAHIRTNGSHVLTDMFLVY